MGNNELEPFVHVFRTSQGYYLFDVNTDAIITINKKLYEYFLPSNMLPETENIKNQIRQLQAEGYLKANRVKYSEHPATKLLPFYINNNLAFITLQITQKCNLRCEYCVYSGNYKHRSHSQHEMSFETAKMAIEYLVDHSKDGRDLIITFYGGEPLLRFDFIKKCVDYAEATAEGRKIVFGLTTNGTLLSEKMINYFYERKFSLTISLDGPKEIHDRFRKFANSDIGSFNILLKNIKKIKEMYPEYYKNNVMFNTVLSPGTDFSCVNNFVMTSELFEQAYFSSSLVNNKYLDSEIIYDEKFAIEWEYEIFKSILIKLKWLKTNKMSKFSADMFTEISRRRGEKHQALHSQLPETGHRGGPCLPGVARLLVSADGALFPCERVSEISEISNIGSIENGIDINKAERILNLEKVTEQKCHNCWAYNYCTTCVAGADDLHELSTEMIEANCDSVRLNAEEMFKDYCVMSELGYDFEVDERNYNLIYK